LAFVLEVGIVQRIFWTIAPMRAPIQQQGCYWKPTDQCQGAEIPRWHQVGRRLKMENLR